MSTALSVCDGGTRATIRLSGCARSLHVSYDRKRKDENIMKHVSSCIRQHRPFAAEVQVSTLVCQSMLLTMHLITGVCQSFSEPIAFDHQPPRLVFECDCARNGTYSLHGISGDYIVHTVEHPQLPTPTTDVRPTVQVSQNDDEIELRVTHASCQTSAANVNVDGIVIHATSKADDIVTYDVSRRPDGLSMLCVGDVGVALLTRPRGAELEVSDYYIKDRGKIRARATLTMFAYTKTLPALLEMTLHSTAVHGAASFNPHESGTLKSLHFHEKGNIPFSHCPCLSAFHIERECHLWNVCLHRDTFSVWLYLDENLSISCDCMQITVVHDHLRIRRGEERLDVHIDCTNRWIHVYSSSNDLYVDGVRHELKESHSYRCKGACVIGKLRALSTYMMDLGACLRERLWRWPDAVIQAVPITYTVTCKWPARSASKVVHKIHGIRANESISHAWLC